MRKKLVFLMIFLSIVAMGATAIIQPVNVYDTLRGMRSAAYGAPGTFIMEKDTLVTFFWTCKNNTGWCFASLTKSGQVVRDLLTYINGTRCDTCTASTLVSGLEADGWKYMAPGALPAAVLTGLKSTSVYMMSIGASSLTTVFFVPVVILQPTPIGVIQ